jgi:hypothetical protein
VSVKACETLTHGLVVKVQACEATNGETKEL